ncbi:AraC family transcriptional regulator [bacterium]|nr:MAG: AraC family transcriptional regulator [bacterium]
MKYRQMSTSHGSKYTRQLGPSIYNSKVVYDIFEGKNNNTIMSTEQLEEIDHFYVDPGPDLSRVWEWHWFENFVSPLPFRNEFPLFLRREYLDRTSKIAHWHKDFMALYVVRRGRGTRVVNGYPHSMARGDVFLMGPDNIHLFDSPIQLYLDAIYFHPSVWTAREWEILRQIPALEAYTLPGKPAFYARGNTDYFGHLSPEPHSKVELALAEMRRDYNAEVEIQHVCLRNQLFNLLVQLAQWRDAGLFTTRPARGAGIAEVLSFCDTHFQKNVPLEQLAAMMHFSDAHFRDVFTREVGMPPATYLRRLRLQHAQTLLRDRTLPVADVARLSGFNDPTTLTRAFKKAFGISPLSFRKKAKIVS